MPALKVNIIIVHPRGGVFPKENSIPRVNNYDVPLKGILSTTIVIFSYPKLLSFSAQTFIK
jgi:hypothetical protein